jgi:hypothetical protein
MISQTKPAPTSVHDDGGANTNARSNARSNGGGGSFLRRVGEPAPKHTELPMKTNTQAAKKNSKATNPAASVGLKVRSNVRAGFEGGGGIGLKVNHNPSRR